MSFAWFRFWVGLLVFMVKLMLWLPVWILILCIWMIWWTLKLGFIMAFWPFILFARIARRR